MKSNLRLAALLVVFASFGWMPGRAMGQGEQSLAAAKALYAEAAYRDALTLLESLKAARPKADEAVEIETYRAFCLVALGREKEADEPIAGILAARPQFRLGEDEVSRRVYTLFEEARRRLLPQVAQRLYERAKLAYDRRDFEQAKSGFTLVATFADDPSLAGVSVLKDLQTLSRGFLALAAANTPPVPATPLAHGAPIAPATKSVYDASDTAIAPPVVVEQRVPMWPASLRPTAEAAVVEVIVNEKGEVESATLAPGFNSPYDELLLAAAKSWRYRPARCGQEPVKFRRRVQIVAGSPPFD